jgi:hypothetical protein
MYNVGTPKVKHRSLIELGIHLSVLLMGHSIDDLIYRIIVGFEGLDCLALRQFGRKEVGRGGTAATEPIVGCGGCGCRRFRWIGIPVSLYCDG